MKLSDDDLLDVCRRYAENAKSHSSTVLEAARQRGARAYRQMPYGTEEEGLSQFVTSEVMDAVEWMKPALLKIYTSTDEVVRFDPTSEEDVEATEQASAGCNYIFTKQNNGFLILHTAITDSLIKRNCAVMWRLEEREDVEYKITPPAPLEVLSDALNQMGGEVVAKSESVSPEGVPLVSAKVKVKTKNKRIKVEAFEPEDLLIYESWNSPDLEECPYVSRRQRRVTLSDLRAAGYDVEEGDLGQEHDETSMTTSTQLLTDDASRNRANASPVGDSSMRETDLYHEFVRVDMDGDGIAELRYIVRLPHKILYNEECDQVQIATASPVLIPHSPYGLSLEDLVGDIQRLKTEITRQMLDSLYLATSPRTIVTNNIDGEPGVNIDDLLTVRPGGIIRETKQGSVRPLEQSFVGGQAFPMLEYADVMKEKKSGITAYGQGTDANSLNKTATGVTAIIGQAMQRIELVARVYAECLVKPIFKGILRLLVNSGMDKPLAFKLHNKFVQYDPRMWKDQYDMTVTVGLGTGNKDQQLIHLQSIAQAQAMAVQAGGLNTLVTPKNIYNVQKKIVENAGFKDVNAFWTEPPDQMPEQPEKPDPEIVKIDKQIELEREKTAAQLQLKEKEVQLQGSLEVEKEKLRQQSDMRKHDLSLKGRRIEMGIDEDPEEAMRTEQIMQMLAAVMQTNQMIAQTMQAQGEMISKIAGPRKSQLVRDAMGKAIGAISVPVEQEEGPAHESGESQQLEMSGE